MLPSDYAWLLEMGFSNWLHFITGRLEVWEYNKYNYVIYGWDLSTQPVGFNPLTAVSLCVMMVGAVLLSYGKKHYSPHSENFSELHVLQYQALQYWELLIPTTSVRVWGRPVREARLGVSWDCRPRLVLYGRICKNRLYIDGI